MAFLKQQLTAKSPGRILWAVTLVAGGFWLGKHSYAEWQVMRVVAVMADELKRQSQQPQPPTRQPIHTDDTWG